MFGHRRVSTKKESCLVEFSVKFPLMCVCVCVCVHLFFIRCA